MVQTKLELKEEMERLETIAGDRVLTISFHDYLGLFNRSFQSYCVKGVQAIEQNYPWGSDVVRLSAMGGLAKLCEELGAEVIVDVKPAILPNGGGVYANQDRIYLIGTALIPK